MATGSDMLVYCDYVAKMIQDKFVEMFNHPVFGEPAVTGLGRTLWELDENGALVSTKKKVRVQIAGKWYLVTIEEVQ